MPLIRLARDKRGLDTVYLFHHLQDARGGSRLKVIYFCAAPQGLSFGRQALDPATQRALEQRYPDVAFDWPALLKEIEQRRLPPPGEPQARRPRPAPKTERRVQASDPKTDSPGGKRKRRRGGQMATSAMDPSPGTALAPMSPVPVLPPIIE